MSLISFKYTKSENDVSSRVFIQLGKPSANVFGIDVTELEDEEQAQVFSEVIAAKNKYDEELREIMKVHDITHNFRQFSPNKMSEVIVES